MELIHVAVDGGDGAVRVDGPASKHVVLLLPGEGDAPDVYDAVCKRLHNSDLRTVVPEGAGWTQAAILSALDQLEVGWVNLVGSGKGAELAWELAARHFGRFASLIVADRGHPAVGGEDCPPVELPTTVMVGSPERRAEADASGRYVYGELRVVETPTTDNVPRDRSAELASEIVLRTSPW
ncbi:alpha/beta fold hydrolase [Rhodococcus sp. NPDC058521]|uniref:alpha/beta fold hydrolase n=1 Tax=Rhodococcus sp. NPDC058521 TaxID=3346536 RepID=UPI003665EABC